MIQYLLSMWIDPTNASINSEEGGLWCGEFLERRISNDPGRQKASRLQLLSFGLILGASKSYHAPS